MTMYAAIHIVATEGNDNEYPQSASHVITTEDNDSLVMQLEDTARLLSPHFIIGVEVAWYESPEERQTLAQETINEINDILTGDIE